MNETETKRTEKNSEQMTINRLPARTWNHLRMNETVVSGIEQPLPEQYEGKLKTGPGFYQADDEQKKLFEEIETALGKDMDRLGENLPVAVIKTAENVDLEKNPTVVDLTADGHYGRYFLHVGKNSKMNVAFYCHSDSYETNSFLQQIKIYAEENSTISLSVVQTFGKQVRVFSDIGGVLEKGATVDLVKMELGGKEVYSGAYMKLKGDNSSFTAHIGYLGEEGQHLDMNYVARHYGKKTNSLMESDGILGEHAFKLFRGTIDFIKGCPGSVGNEKEDVLLLGDDVVNQTIPLILCAEEDVEGNHGASIGELDEKTLFYLMSRGFSKEEAEKMIADARLEAVAEKIQEDSVRKTTLEYLEGRK